MSNIHTTLHSKTGDQWLSLVLSLYTNFKTKIQYIVLVIKLAKMISRKMNNS